MLFLLVYSFIISIYSFAIDTNALVTIWQCFEGHVTLIVNSL